MTPSPQHSPPRASPEPELGRSAAGLLALQALPRIGAATAMRAAMVPAFFDALVKEHAAAWADALDRASQTLDDCRRRDIAVLSFFDATYPQRLRAIHDPPPLLFVRGAVSVLDDERLAAVVGTREPTSFGRSATQELTAALASAAWGIVSGLARGIDTLAHLAALEGDVPTIAVLAGGLDRIYPHENTGLAERIVERGGALVSELAPGVSPRRSSFVARNRLQTGLSAAVVVAQTGLRGGTMHTARHAATQGRPVFCPTPHSEHEKNAGLWMLLRSPARQLCTELPAWRDAQSLCVRLSDTPLARAVNRDEIVEFLDWLEVSLELPQTTPQPRWWPSEADASATAGDWDEAEDEASLFGVETVASTSVLGGQ